MSKNDENSLKNAGENEERKEEAIHIDEESIFASDKDISESALSESELNLFHRNLIEGALYASDKPLTIEELSMKLEISKNEVETFLNELIDIYEERATCLSINKVGFKFQMQIKPEYSEKLYQFAEGGAIAEKYLRTLTIIALKQPLLKSTLIKLRGSGAYEHVKYLKENGLIDTVKKGRTSELTTTDKYAEMFGLPKNIEEMKKVMINQLGLEPEE